MQALWCRILRRVRSFDRVSIGKEADVPIPTRDHGRIRLHGGLL
jgi:hypothetical protein